MALPSPILKTLAAVGRRIGPAFDRPTPARPPARMLIFQAGGIGDMLRIFPLLLSIRQAWPESRLFTLTPFASTVFDLLAPSHAIERRFSYDPEREHRGIRRKWALTRLLRGYHFDLIVNPGRGEGMIENALIAYAIGAPTRVGFDRDGAGFLHTHKVALDDQRPIVQQNLDLLRALGVEPAVATAPLHVPFEASAEAEHLVPPGSDALIALHPGSHWRHHLQWPAERYAAVANALLSRYPCRVLLLGTPDEASLTGSIARTVGHPRLLDLGGRTTLMQAAAVLSRCRLFIGNDSGLLHVALGFKVPSIGIFGYTSPRQVIAPEGPCIALQKDHGTARYLHQPFYRFPHGANPITLIQVDEVLQAASRLLERPPAPSSG